MSNENEVLVRVEGVSKKFCRDLKKSLWYGIKDVASELLPIQNSKSKIQNPCDALRPGEFWANKDISFELRRGECLGLIGHNGAGKTTLLKMLNGLIKPDEGSIEMHGRVGALIALGAGFNPILTGRENIYVNGSVLGLTKHEIDSRIDEIIDFAEIGEFIDAPVQSYSSGMQVRLGFAVATALHPDILILDEVLAVGDALFRAKCLLRLSKILPNSCAIFVSHNDMHIRHICDRVILLQHGSPVFTGDPSEGLEEYHRLRSRGRQHSNLSDSRWQFDEETIRAISASMQILPCDFRNKVIVTLQINSIKEIEIGYVRAALCSTGDQIDCFLVNDKITSIPAGISVWELEGWPVDLTTSNYSVNLFISDASRKRVFAHGVNVSQIRIESSEFLGCNYAIPSSLRQRGN